MTTITFITGANKSLGYETARRLSEMGQAVILGARDPERGAAAAERPGALVTSHDSLFSSAPCRFKEWNFLPDRGGREFHSLNLRDEASTF